MKKMYWKKAEQQYNQKMETLDKIENCLKVDFDSLKENTELEIGRIIGYLGLNVSKTRIKKAIQSVIKEPNLTKQETEHYTNYL